jgi:hypothetical protein
MSAELPICTCSVTLDADALVDIEYDGDGEYVMFVGQSYQRCAVLRLHVGGIHYDQASQLQTQTGYTVEGGKCCLSDALVTLIVSYDTAIVVGAEYLCRLEVSGREGALT